MGPDDQPRLRWNRAQRFKLTEKGVDAEGRWRTRLTEVRAQGREAFDAARTTWAQELSVSPDDSTTLSELAQGPLRLEDVMKALADTGTTRDSVKKTLERLLHAGLVEANSAG